MTEFKQATNEIEHLASVEEICDFFGVEDPTPFEHLFQKKLRQITQNQLLTLFPHEK